MSRKSLFIVVVFYEMSRKSRFRVVVFPNESRLVSHMNRFLPRAQKLNKTILFFCPVLVLFATLNNQFLRLQNPNLY